MFDLNIDVFSVSSDFDDETERTFDTKIATEKLFEEARTGTDDSATSTSSVVNEDPSLNSIMVSSYTCSSILNFSVLDRDQRSDVIVFEDESNENVASEMVTRQLFPSSGNQGCKGEKPLAMLPASSLLRPHWLNLSVPESGKGTDDATIFKQRAKKSRRGPRSRSSQYRGVTFYRRTGRWESHIWDSGKQLYLGGFDTAHAAARVYDRAAIKFRGVEADINFNVRDYEEDFTQMKNLTKEEFVRILRRQSPGSSRWISKYRATMRTSARREGRGIPYPVKRANDKVGIRSNRWEAQAIAHAKPDVCTSEIYSGTNACGCCDTSLDLNLRISSPTVSLTGYNNARKSYFLTASELPNLRRQKEREVEIVEAIRPAPLTGFSIWRRNIEGQDVIYPMHIFQAAASSGFSSTVAARETFVTTPKRA